MHVADSPGFILWCRMLHWHDTLGQVDRDIAVIIKWVISCQNILPWSHTVSTPAASNEIIMVVGILATLATLATLAASVPLEERQSCSSVWYYNKRFFQSRKIILTHIQGSMWWPKLGWTVLLCFRKHLCVFQWLLLSVSSWRGKLKFFHSRLVDNFSGVVSNID